MRRSISVPTLLAACLLSGRANAQSSPPSWAASMDSMMLGEMARTQTPGAQIAVVAGGRLAYTKGYGVADVETGRPVTERTLFLVGSVSKLLTATLLARLSAEGAVDLQAPVSRYVTELAGRRVGAVTTHQLLTHSAGWRDYGNPFGRLDDTALGDVFRAVTDTMVMTDPGRVFSYSNPSFSMAGYVAERATGRRYATLADSLVLRPLGMSRSTFRPTMAMTYDVAVGHVGPLGPAPRAQRPMPANAVDAPSGFMFTNAAELSRLALALMDGGTLDGRRVLPAEAVRAMTTGHVPVPGERTRRIGYGMEVDSVGGRRVWQKNGSVSGFNAHVTMWPDDRLAVVVITNRFDLLPERATPHAARIAAGITTPVAVVFRGERDATPAERAELVGTYALGPVRLEVSEAGGALAMRQQNGETRPARLTRDGSRLVVGAPTDSVPHPYVIVRDEGGHVRFLYRDNKRTYAKQP